MSVGRVIYDLLAHVLVMFCQSKRDDTYETWTCNPPAISPVTQPQSHGGNWLDAFLSMDIIYSWLLQPYGMVSQKVLTFLRFAPASLQSAVQLLSLIALETVGQYWSSQSKRDLNPQPSNFQSHGITSRPWRQLVWTNFFDGHYLQLATSTL